MPGELEPPTHRTETETTTDSTPEETSDGVPIPFPLVASGVDPATRALPGATARCVLETTGAPSNATGDAGSTACPDCGSATVNGAGLFTCFECSWTGVLR